VVFSAAVARYTGAMKLREHLEIDKQTGVLDVHVLDVLAQIESLLRHAREIQRQILTVRGVPKKRGAAQRRAAASEVRERARRMADETAALSKILRELQRDSDAIEQVTDERWRVSEISLDAGREWLRGKGSTA
jgi:hypothetical protein